MRCFRDVKPRIQMVWSFFSPWFYFIYFMLQLCFDRSSLIINVVLLRSALEVIVPVSAEPTRAGFDFYTWWEKLPLTATPSSFCLIIGYFFSFSLSFELSQRVHLLLSDPLYSFTNTHKHSSIGGSPEWRGYSAWHVSVIYYWSDPAASIRLQIVWIYHCLTFCHKHNWQGNVCVRLMLHGGMLSQIMLLRLNLFFSVDFNEFELQMCSGKFQIINFWETLKFFLIFCT